MVTKVKGSVTDAPEYAVAAPATGTHVLGEVVFNSAGGANVGWVCTAAGTPGTWLPFGTKLQLLSTVPLVS